MKKNLLIYGTYNRKEWTKIKEICEALNIDYKEYEHEYMHIDRTAPYEERKNYRTFWRLESYVTPEEEKMIRTQREILKKRYS